MKKNNNTSNKIIKDLVEGITSNENFKKEVSVRVAKILSKQKDTLRKSFEPSNLMSFLSGKGSTKEVVTKILGTKGDATVPSDKKNKESKLKEKKTYSAFYSKVPSRTSIPLKRGDSVSDIMSKLYTFFDRSFTRKEKEKKEAKKLQKEQDKKRDSNNKKLLKSLAGSGFGLFGKNKGSGKKKDTQIFGLTPEELAFLGTIGALSLPSIYDALKDLDIDGFMKKIDSFLEETFKNIGKHGLPFGISEGSRRISQAQNIKQKRADKRERLKKRAEELKNKSEKGKTATPSIKTEETAPSTKTEETKTAEKPKASNIPKKSVPEKAQKLRERSESRRLAKKSTATPAPAEVKPEPTATKYSKVAKNIETIRDNAKKVGDILGKTGKAGLFLGRLLPIASLTSDLTKALEEYHKNKDEKLLKRTSSGIIGGFIGATIGARAMGALVGAGAGSAVPGLGTVVGGILGFAAGTIGGGAGASMGKDAGEKIYDLLDKADVNLIDLSQYQESLSKLSEMATKFDETTGFTKGMDWAGEKISAVGGDLGDKAYQAAKEGLGINTTNAQETTSTTAADFDQWRQNPTLSQMAESPQGISNLHNMFAVDTNTATIVADRVNTGETLTELDRTQQQLISQPSSPTLINNSGTSVIKGQGKQQEYGELSAKHKLFEPQNSQWKENMALSFVPR